MKEISIVNNENEVVCPFCGKHNYQISSSHKACIDVKPIVKDGVVINLHPDAVENLCLCMNCNNVFSYKIKVKKEPQLVEEKTTEEEKALVIKSEEKLEVQEEEEIPIKVPVKTISRKKKTKTIEEK